MPHSQNLTRFLCLLLSLAALSAPAFATGRPVILQSTTSTQNSGLLDHLLPLFLEKTGIEVRTVAVGTGQAIRNAANGDGDVLLVHAKAAELAFVEAGHGLARHDVMYNDFVVIGPKADPAGISDAPDALSALRRIAASGVPFASRGDDSGTHKAELRLWQTAGIPVTAASGDWYRETGAGMGATLNIAVGMGAYTLSDRATWISFGNKGGHQIVHEGDPRLFNQYGVIAVNPARHPGVNAEGAARFLGWLLSAEGQAAIGEFRVGGQQLFFPNGAASGPSTAQ